MLDAWQLEEGWTAGDRFRNQVEFDPTWSAENVFVVVEQDQILSVVSILPRHLKILGHSIPSGGLGNLYTDPAMRRRGIATELIDRACDAMRSRGFELALLFSGTSDVDSEFFEKRGWHTWGGQKTILRRAPDGSQRTDSEGSDDIEFQPIHPDDERAFQSVKSIHAAYDASRSGTVVRDDDLWRAGFQAMPGINEEFWIARRGGLTVAYARVSIVEDVLTITEFGRFEDGASALAKLVASQLEPREEDPLIQGAARGRIASAELRSFLVLPTFDDIGFTVALEHRGVNSHPMDDARASLRCVNLIGFASRLYVDLLPDEDGAAFLERILPPGAMVFWPADRF